MVILRAVVRLRDVALLTEKTFNDGETTHIACRHYQQLLLYTKRELPTWIYVRGKAQFKSMCCLEGIECVLALLPYITFDIAGERCVTDHKKIKFYVSQGKNVHSVQASSAQGPNL